MPIVADAAARVGADINPFIRDLQKLDKPVQGLGAKLKASLSPAVLFGGAFAAGFAATKVVDFLGDAVDAASSLNETVSKTGQIFGEDALPAMEEWAETAADAFGQSKQQALDAASTFAIFGKSAGLAGDDLVSFSQDLTVLASDFASFFDTSPEEAITAIGAALRGESEPIRRYGVLLDEATLRQRALRLGIIETTSQALTPQQRVLAAQAEIFAQSADAQGDFARTSDSLANVSRSLESKMSDLSAEIGEGILPAMVMLAEAAVAALDAIGALGDGITDFLATEIAVGTELQELNAAFGKDPFRQGIQAFFELEHAADIAGEGIEAGAGQITAASREMLRGIWEQAAEARRKAAAEARATPGEIAKALIQGQQEVEDGMLELTTLMEESLSDAAKIAHLKGILASEELAAGLRDERADVRAAAMEVRDDALRELELLESGAYDIAVDAGMTAAAGLSSTKVANAQAAAAVAKTTRDNLAWDATAAGRAVGNSYARGLLQALNAVYAAAETLASQASGQLAPWHSPPRFGPLKNIDTDAQEIGQLWAENLGQGIADSWMPDVLMPPVPTVTPTTPGQGTGIGVPGSVTNNFNLNVTGAIRVDEARDAIDELRRLAN